MMEGRDFARDIISGLPDPVLTHILSFLPIEEAVHTCILAKRWIKVWASLPVLIFLYDPVDNLTQEEYRKCEAKFLRFLGGVICHREKITLDTFKLTWWKNIERGTLLHIFEFLRCAVECTPRILSIHINLFTFLDLPDSIFTCTSVEEFSLWLTTNDYPHEDNILEPRTINLPLLKTLELGYLVFNDDIMIMLKTGCPILEELVLINCYLEVKMISYNVLKKLVVKDCKQFGPIMEIFCPRVVSLCIESLYEGDITTNIMSGGYSCTIFEETNHDLRLLSGLSNVKSLKLYTTSPVIMGSLQEDISSCPILKNLKSLEFGVLDFKYDWDIVACLLQHSLNLKDLTLHYYRSDDSDEEECEQKKYSIQHEYLEKVKIIYPGKNVKLVEELVHDQDELVVTTAKIIILACEREDQGSSSAMVARRPARFPS